MAETKEHVTPNSIQDPTHPDYNISQDMLPWIHKARFQKETWIKTVGTKPKLCDMHPLVFPERNGKIVAIIVAPTLDKNKAMEAACACRRCMRADAITLVMDAHIKSMPAEKGAEFVEQYKYGDMQRACDEEGACERDEISDCLIAYRHEEAGRMVMVCLPYKYKTNPDGSHGPEFVWTPKLNVMMDSKMEGLGLEGNIPDALRWIMQQPYIANDIPQIGESAKEFGFSEERTLYYTGRAILRLFAEKGYVCFDLADEPE